MKRLFLVIISSILINTISFGQKWTPEIICSTDTLTVEPYISMKYNPEKMDSAKQEPYKIVQCRTRSKVGFRMDIAVSRITSYNVCYTKLLRSVTAPRGSEESFPRT